MNQQSSTSLIPLGPNGQLLDPVSFLIYLLLLPIRIVTEIIRQVPAPPSLLAAETHSLVPWRPFPLMTSLEQPLTMSKVIEAPSYTVLPASSPSPAPATYENEERCEIVWNEDGLPTEIIIHRKATRT